MTVKEILKTYLIVKGYDGLYLNNNECICWIDDLMDCGGDSSDCEPGYLQSSGVTFGSERCIKK